MNELIAFRRWKRKIRQAVSLSRAIVSTVLLASVLIGVVGGRFLFDRLNHSNTQMAVATVETPKLPVVTEETVPPKKEKDEERLQNSLLESVQKEKPVVVEKKSTEQTKAEVAPIVLSTEATAMEQETVAHEESVNAETSASNVSTQMETTQEQTVAEEIAGNQQLALSLKQAYEEKGYEVNIIQEK